MRLIVLYIILVGTPILGVLGILRLGHQLQAPTAIGGAWQLSGNAASDSACPPAGLPQAGALAISQSGRYLELRFDHGLVMPARWENGRLETPAHPLAPATPASASCQVAQLSAALRQTTDGQPTLAGEWHLPDCTPCGTVPFGATQAQAPAPVATSGH